MHYNQIRKVENSRGMKNPANRVVNELGFREGLVSTLMRNDPQPSAKQPGGETVQRP